MSANKQSIDSLLETFDLSEVAEADREGSLPVTFWLPMDDKERYDDIQRLSKRKFHKFLKTLIVKQIKNVKI